MLLFLLLTEQRKIRNRQNQCVLLVEGVELLAQERKQGLGWITLTRRQEQKVGKMLFVKFSLYQV